MLEGLSLAQEFTLCAEKDNENPALYDRPLERPKSIPQVQTGPLVEILPQSVR